MSYLVFITFASLAPIAFKIIFYVLEFIYYAVDAIFHKSFPKIDNKSKF